MKLQQHPDRDVRRLLAPLFKRGWVFECINKHYKIRSPAGRLLSMSLTSANPAAIKRIQADIARIERSENETH